jgi:hypothetical protein
MLYTLTLTILTDVLSDSLLAPHTQSSPLAQLQMSINQRLNYFRESLVTGRRGQTSKNKDFHAVGFRVADKLRGCTAAVDSSSLLSAGSRIQYFSSMLAHPAFPQHIIRLISMHMGAVSMRQPPRN